MKKVIALIMCFSMLSGLFIVQAYASADADNAVDYPTIIVAGYSSSALLLDRDDGSQKFVWGLDMQDVLSRVLHNIANIGVSLGEAVFGKPDYLASLVGENLTELCSELAYNADGESIYPLHTFSQSAENTSFSYLRENYGGQYCYETEIMADVAAYYDDNGKTGYDNIFSFQTDFRQNVVDCAADLDKYIDSVLDYTGADKVNIYAVSHGGQVTATYLNLYGAEKCCVNNAVLTVPAIGGAALAYDVMSENVVFDEETLLRFVENGMMFEEDYDWLLRAEQLGFLDKVLNIIVRDYAKSILGYWGSIWDFIPAEYYDDMKEMNLNSEESSSLIAKSDYFHYEILPSMHEKLTECENSGINIYIVAGADSPSVTGLQETSDGIITVNSSTGAKTAPYSLRFSDGYTCSGDFCGDYAHNHLAPAMNIDATVSYLPEQTWFISGLFHGMTWKDSYAMNLAMKLLFSDEKLNVHSDASYPQFRYSTNVCHSADASFNNTEYGYITGDSDTLTVKNLSEKYIMKLISVSCAGADVIFRIPKVRYLKPGEETDISFSGAFPDVSLATADITVTYSLLGSITPIGERTFTFTVMNGQESVYDSNNPYVPLRCPTAFDNIKTADCINKNTGLFDFIKMIFNAFCAMLKSMSLIFA